LNVIDKETLLKARKEPEQYRSLIVRVSGFSAHFTELDSLLQDEIILRTEHAT
jgi:formate C-acetyltransferase